MRKTMGERWRTWLDDARRAAKEKIERERNADARAEVKRAAAIEREKRATERAIYAAADAERDRP
jgi:hypothetical protein